MGWVMVSLLGLAALSVVAWTLVLGISPMPSSRRAREAMLGLVDPGTVGVIHELGAGWGGLAVGLAERCRGARVIAWERSPVPWLVSWLRARRHPNLEVRWADFRAADFSGATVLVCYLFTGGMQRVDERLRRDRPRDVVVVTNTFLLRGWEPEVVVTLDDLYRTKVARYRGVPG